VAYYAGLFHDLGKVNPYYQELFRGGMKEELKKTYDSFHAPYSCWFAKSLLKDTDLDKEDQRRVMMIIDAHHSAMKNNPGNFLYDGSKSPHLINQTLKQFLKFKDSVSEIKNLYSDIPNTNRLKFDKRLKTKSGESGPDAFLECGFLFSSVLQSDRGSFSQFQEKVMNDSFEIDTAKLATNNRLADYRDAFQANVRENIDTANPITVLCAPTGSGKTKAFLDLVSKFNPSRVFYFSPLLTLTDDISEKLATIFDKNSDEILVYNHAFTNTLDKKDIDEQSISRNWEFDFEAFNEKMVITTTQRLLMTIYSNSSKDKLKLASFRGSLLIIDEVQTLPKFLLKNLISILESMNKYLNTKTLLVSATIPHDLEHLPKLSMPDNYFKRYLKEKKRKIAKSTFDKSKIKKEKTLVMTNTKKNAKNIYNQIQHEKKFYITSGVKKESRVKILESIKNQSNCVLISTQVVEAGVDISFDTIWRQMAPLDSIIQVMGRLDRESENTDAMLYLFDVDACNPTPYTSLEFNTSKEIIKDIDNSVELYAKLPDYYKRLSTKDVSQKNQESRLLDLMEKLEFGEVWNMIKNCLGDSYAEPVFIPDTASYDMVCQDLLSDTKHRVKKHGGLVALLPVPSYTMKEFFDDKLYEKNILFPKKEKLTEIYDMEIGLDKWKK